LLPNNTEKQAIDMPSLLKFNVDSGVISLKFDKPFKRIDFIGQDGIMKDNQYESDSGTYKIKPEDTYIREEVVFKDSTRFYFNPVFRYTGEIQYQEATINWDKTWMLRIVSGIIFLIIILLTSLLKIKHRAQKTSNEKTGL
jgi:hypothetical protein